MNGLGTAKAQATATEPPRIEKIRRELIEAIPRVPNDRTSLAKMQQKHLPELLVHYFNWRSRYVGMRPRTVTVETAAQTDPRWSALAPAIKAFLAKVRRGDDLTPHLSFKPHTRGYAHAASAPRATTEDRWEDKDFLLNTMDYHHFHLSAAKEDRRQSNDLIFAKADRDTFKVIAIFGHEVFDQNSAERERLWAVHQEVAFRAVAPGAVVIMSDIQKSGHAGRVVRFAQHCGRLIRQIEPTLDGPDVVKKLYRSRPDAPDNTKLEWAFVHLDLAIFDAGKPLVLVAEGWN